MENADDESMSAKRFWTTPKGDLPQFAFIFRKPEALREESKNLACSRLGFIIYLKIQKGKEFMKIADI